MNMLWTVALMMFFCQQLSCWPTVEEDTVIDQQSSDQSSLDESTDRESEIKIEPRAVKKQKHLFRAPPKNIVGVYGSSVTLNCAGKSNNLQWIFLDEVNKIPVVIVNNCTLIHQTIGFYDVDKTTDSCNLEIKSLKLDMAGTYTCFEMSPNQHQASAHLIAIKSDPVCTSSVDGKKFIESGTEVTLTCLIQYAGPQAPVMTWTNDRNRIIIASSLKTENNYVESKITVKAHEPNLEPYTCRTNFKKLPSIAEGYGLEVATNEFQYTSTWISNPVQAILDRNFALNQNTIQSSTYNDSGSEMIADYAVDGNTDPEVGNNSCTRTLVDNPSWWAVHLREEIGKQETPIGHVRITNGNCAGVRLQDFYIGLTNVSPWGTPPPQLNEEQRSICKYYEGILPAGVATDIFCEADTKPGRYLYVMLTKVDFLTICELEAYINF